MDAVGTWVSILEYASLKSISISTIRRQIKSNNLEVSIVGGKYYIWVDSQELSKKFEVEQVKLQNQKLLEEINDLKMLLTLYEGRDNTTGLMQSFHEINI